MRAILLWVMMLGACDRKGTTLDQYVEADEVTAEHHGKTVKLHGYVAPGSVVKDQTGAYRFRVVRRKGGVDVTFGQVVPERFQEKLEVIVTGKLADDGASLHGTELVAKCPDDYEALPQWTADAAP